MNGSSNSLYQPASLPDDLDEKVDEAIINDGVPVSFLNVLQSCGLAVMRSCGFEVCRG